MGIKMPNDANYNHGNCTLIKMIKMITNMVVIQIFDENLL